MTTTDFWLNFASNSLATILGLIIGIPVAFWVERQIEKSRNRETQKQNEEKRGKLLTRLLIQVTNAESRLRAFQDINERSFLIYAYFQEVEVIEALHRELTLLETDWDVLLAVDMVISSLKSLNSLLSVNRSMVMVKENSVIFGYSEKFVGDLDYQMTVVSESINDFRELAFERYSDFVERVLKSTSA